MAPCVGATAPRPTLDVAPSWEHSWRAALAPAKPGLIKAGSGRGGRTGEIGKETELGAC